MVRTDGRTDTEGYNIIPRHTLVAGYKNGMFGHGGGGGGDAVKMLKNFYYKNLLETYFVKTCR